MGYVTAKIPAVPTTTSTTNGATTSTASGATSSTTSRTTKPNGAQQCTASVVATFAIAALVCAIGY